MSDRVIDVRGLRKSYGDFEAVKGIDFHVDRGEVFALLGPNGAGKTTTAEILEGFRERTAGDVDVLGHDPANRELDLRQRIGIVLQSTGVDPYLTVRETVELYAGYYPKPRDVDEVIERRRPRREAGRARGQALGRPAAPAGRGDRAGGRPRAPLPRRADHRVRPERPAARVGDGQEPDRAREDRLPHDAFHGRSAVPGQPCGGHRQGRSRRRGSAVDDRRTGHDADRRSGSGRPRRVDGRAADRPDRHRRRDVRGPAWTTRPQALHHAHRLGAGARGTVRSSRGLAARRSRTSTCSSPAESRGAE